MDKGASVAGLREQIIANAKHAFKFLVREHPRLQLGNVVFDVVVWTDSCMETLPLPINPYDEDRTVSACTVYQARLSYSTDDGYVDRLVAIQTEEYPDHLQALHALLVTTGKLAKEAMVKDEGLFMRNMRNDVDGITDRLLQQRLNADAHIDADTNHSGYA